MRFICRKTVQTFKFIAMLAIIFGYLFHMLLFRLICKSYESYRRESIRWKGRYARGVTWVLNIKISSFGEEYNQNTYYFASNHMSYLDIIVFSSLKDTTYVTSQEVREMPVLGIICELAGCVFVERRDKSNLSNEIKNLSQSLESGLKVTIFPEATSTNGEQILRFRKPLFQAAIDSKKGVAPMCLNYRSIDGEPFSKKNRDLVCWYGDMDFISHLWKLCGLNEIAAEVTYFPNIKPDEQTDPQALAQICQDKVTSAFNPAT